eukprot:118495-Hanusia_phi.AAC.1
MNDLPEDLKFPLKLNMKKQTDLQVFWKKPQSALDIRLEPGIGIQFTCEDHDGNEVTRIGMIVSILSETSVE